MVYLEYNSVKLLVLDDYNIAKSSQELTFSDIKCDFTGHSAEDLPEKYQEIKVISEEKTRELLFIGYLEDYVFDEMRELDIDTSINFTLMTPKKNYYAKNLYCSRNISTKRFNRKYNTSSIN